MPILENSQFLLIFINVFVLIPLFAFLFITSMGGLNTTRPQSRKKNARFYKPDESYVEKLLELEWLFGGGGGGDDEEEPSPLLIPEITSTILKNLSKADLGDTCQTNQDCGNVSWLECTSPINVAQYAPKLIASSGFDMDSNNMHCLPTRQALNHDCDQNKGGTLQLVMPTSKKESQPRFVCQCTRPEYFVNNGVGDCGTASACSNLGGTVVPNTDTSISAIECNCPMAPLEYFTSDNGLSEPRCISYTFFDSPVDPPNYNELVYLPYEFIDEAYLEHFQGNVRDSFKSNGVFALRHLPDPCAMDALDGSKLGKKVAYAYFNSKLNVVHCRISDKYQSTHVPLIFDTDYLKNNNGRYPNGVVRLRRSKRDNEPGEPDEKDITSYGLEFDVNNPKRLVPLLIGKKKSLRKGIIDLIKSEPKPRLFASEYRKFFRFFYIPSDRMVVASQMTRYLANLNYNNVFTLSLVPEMILESTPDKKTLVKLIGYIPVYIPVMELNEEKMQGNHYVVQNLGFVESHQSLPKSKITELNLAGSMAAKGSNEHDHEKVFDFTNILTDEIVRVLNEPKALKLAIPPTLTFYERDDVFQVNHVHDSQVFALQFNVVPLKEGGIKTKTYPKNAQLLLPIYVKPAESGNELASIKKIFLEKQEDRLKLQYPNENEIEKLSSKLRKLVILTIDEKSFAANARPVLYMDLPEDGHVFTPLDENFNCEWKNYLQNLEKFVGKGLDDAISVNNDVFGGKYSRLSLKWQLSVATASNLSRYNISFTHPSLYIMQESSKDLVTRLRKMEEST